MKPETPAAATASPLKAIDDRVPLKLIEPSGTNDGRAKFDPGNPLDLELVASIKQHGILSALWVRQIAGKNGARAFKIIAGERRWAAARTASLADAPVRIFSNITEEQALALQLVENAQRADISAVGEGRAYQRLLSEHGYTAERLVVEVGKSKSHIVGRVKLATLPKLGLEALEAGRLTPSVALRVARIPNPEHLREALKELCGYREPVSDRRAAEIIEHRWMVELKGAPFNREDPALNPERGACSKCPYRSGNQREMFPEMAKGRADVCTDPACYQLKSERGVAQRLEEHRAAGGIVLGRQAAGIDQYGQLQRGSKFANLDGARWNGKASYRAELKGREKPAVTLVQTKDGVLLELVEKTALQAAGVVIEERSSGGSEYQAQQKAERARALVETAVYGAQIGVVVETIAESGAEAFVAELLPLLARFLAADASADAARFIIKRRGIDPSPWKKDHNVPHRAALAALAAESAGERTVLALIVELLLAPPFSSSYRRKELREVAGVVGVDLDAAEKAARARIHETKVAQKAKPARPRAIRHES